MDSTLVQIQYMNFMVVISMVISARTQKISGMKNGIMIKTAYSEILRLGKNI